MKKPTTMTPDERRVQPYQAVAVDYADLYSWLSRADRDPVEAPRFPPSEHLETEARRWV